MFSDFLDFLIGGVFDLLENILDLLPVFPFTTIQGIIDAWKSYEILGTVLSWVNWFLPFGPASTIITIWTVAIMAYVVVKLGFKYAKVVVP